LYEPREWGDRAGGAVAVSGFDAGSGVPGVFWTAANAAQKCLLFFKKKAEWLNMMHFCPLRPIARQASKHAMNSAKIS